MKHLGLMLFSLFATVCSAAKCVASGDLDGSVIYEQFQTGVLNVPVPTFQYGDKGGANFSINLNKVFRAYSVSLIDNVICQAVNAGTQLANCVKNASREVIEATKSTNQEGANANGDLKKLTNLLNAVLELQPGNKDIENPLPSLPHQPVEYLIRTKRRTLKELFLEFDLLFDIGISNGYGYIMAAFLEGWRNERLGFRDFSTKIRNQILNDKVLAAARASVDEIYNCGVVVQKCVLPETWEHFKKASYRIIKISNDYDATQEGGDGCSSCTDCPYRLD